MEIKRSVKKIAELGIGLTAIATLILAGCGGGSSSSTVATTTLSVKPVKGQMNHALVSITDATKNPLGSGYTDSTGLAKVAIPATATGPFIVTVSCDTSCTYFNENAAVLAMVSGVANTTGTTMQAVVPDATYLAFGVDAATHAAAQIAQASGVTPTTSSVNAANATVAVQLGVGGNILTTPTTVNSAATLAALTTTSVADKLANISASFAKAASGVASPLQAIYDYGTTWLTAAQGNAPTVPTSINAASATAAGVIFPTAAIATNYASNLGIMASAVAAAPSGYTQQQIAALIGTAASAVAAGQSAASAVATVNNSIPTVGTNTKGMSKYSLYIDEGTFTYTGTFAPSTITNVASTLTDYAGVGTSATVPYTSNLFTGIFGGDHTGNLWGYTNTLSTVGGWSLCTTAIVKYPSASTNPSTLTPTTVITYPINSTTCTVVNNHPVFDSAGNLWVDEITVGASFASSMSIVEYTIASGYQTKGAVIPYSPLATGSGCVGAGLAFRSNGNLVALENYNVNVTGGGSTCNNQIVEYTIAGTTATKVTSTYYPTTAYAGQQGNILVDASDNLWVFSETGPNSCHYNTPGKTPCSIAATLYEVSNTGILLQQLSMPSGIGGGGLVDANGNIWYGVNGNFGQTQPPCTTTYTNTIYELPAGTSTPVVALSKTGSCASGSMSIYGGGAITPYP